MSDRDTFQAPDTKVVLKQDVSGGTGTAVVTYDLERCPTRSTSGCAAPTICAVSSDFAVATADEPNNPGLATVGAAAAHPRGTAEGNDVMSEMELHPSAASRPTGRDEGWGYSSESASQDS